MENDQQSQGEPKGKSKFLAKMSREIQSSMNNIIIQSDLLKRTNVNVEQSDCIDAIYESVHKLSWMVNDVLDFSQLESGQIDLQAVDFNLEYLINDVFRKTVEQKKDHPIDTYIDIAKDVPVDLIGDPTRLRQVLVNLLSNALKFTLKGEVGIIVTNISDRPANTDSTGKVKIQIAVKDSGQGVSKDKLKSIFDRHSPQEPPSSWGFGGTGPGLVICKFIVEAMGGTIEVESQEGKGSQFVINLFFIKGTSFRDREVYPMAKKALVGKKAIIVDDNEIARKILKKGCEAMRIDPVLITSSPRAVLQMLDHLSERGAIPDLILCDIMMPEMDGYEMVKKARLNDRCKAIKIIAITSAIHVGGARNAQDSGFDGFLPKPVFLDELARVITTVLGDKREDRAIVTRHMAEELKFGETKVLVIENEGSDQKLLEECLTMMECEKDFVQNGQEAIESLEEKIYDLCLLDFDIFKKEGTEIVRIIKEVSWNTPTIVLLPTDMEKHRTECLDAGIDDFVIKLVDMIGVKRVIKRYGKS